MKCPTCNKTIEYAGNPFRPFCSERCKMIDLGKWAGGTYRIPTQERPPEGFETSNDPFEPPGSEEDHEN
ncbi:MAG TPA: DNA gyrase inhibitor YacG [Terriglobia bacterium]|nr:DNA gyrase inhibitor YacG [Terriglobia bacterium]